MNYIISTMKNNKFVCNFKAKFENTNDEDIDIEIIIDTGCSHSHISADLFTIFLSDEERLDEKDKWINKRKAIIGRGIESANINISMDISRYNPRVTILNRLYDIKLNGIDIGNHLTAISYDTCMVALLGMEFLKNMDFHIAVSKITNKCTLIACPKDKLNDDYYRALDDHFGLGNNILSATI